MWNWGKKEEKSPVTELDVDLLQFDQIGIIDEDSIQVSESDLQDPNLLAELHNLRNSEDEGDGAPHTLYVAQIQSFDEESNTEKTETGLEEMTVLKHRALQLKKEGKKAEALEIMREIKNLQAKLPQTSEQPAIQNKEIPQPLKNDRCLPDKSDVKLKSLEVSIIPEMSNHIVRSNQDSTQGPPILSSPLATSPVAMTDIFGPFENAINEAMKSLLLEAKEVKDSNPPKAAEKFRKYKALKEELLVVAARRQIPGATPPLFHWKTTSREIPIEDPRLGDDQLLVRIEKASDLESILQPYSSRTLSIKYNVGVIKDSPECQTKQVRYKSGEKIAEFNEENIFTFRRKGSSIDSQFSRKKANFELILHRGMFQSDVVLGTVKLSLAELLTKCKIGGALQVTDSNGRKAVGGSIDVYIMLRRPISKPEIKVEMDRELVISEWPEVVKQTPLPHAQVIPDISQVVSPPALIQANKSSVDFSRLSDLEKDDPLNINLIVSNDVLENEITSMENNLKTCQDPDERNDLQLRLMLLQGKLAVLVNQVQTETLSLEDYVEMVKRRLDMDKLLAVYCNQNNRKTEAIQVMKRVRLMQAEVESVEQANQDA